MGSIEKTIAEHHGLHATSERMIEAMAELTQAITKFWRYDGVNQVIINGRKEGIIESIANTEVMLAQLKSLLDTNGKVERLAAEKAERELGRIIVENGKKLENKNSEHLSNENLRVE
jgi:hypothetical protein